MTTKIYDVIAARLPVDKCRVPPRDRALQDEDYVEKFDSETLYYDVFRLGDSSMFVGPPIGGASTPGISTYELLDVSRRRFPVSQRMDRAFKVLVPNWVPSEASGDESNEFAGRTVLVTMSRDNSLVWVRDWLTFHAHWHAVDAVLIYDNGSSTYTADDLANACASVPQLSVVGVVRWPFKYGPQGGSSGIWDSNYSQHGMLEHARWRFLRKAKTVINADVDELLIHSGGRPVGELVGRRINGYLRYPGRWITMTESKPHQGPPRHADCIRRLAGESVCPTKWTVSPARIPFFAQWSVHRVRFAFGTGRVDGFEYRHFKPINTGWKYDRSDAASVEGSEIDMTLLERMSVCIR